MLPGFNHNIRYKDRVFHVQTEDNGLSQPRLVTQVFIDGHVLALEKTNYQDILDRTADPGERAGLVKSKMQDQHRRLLKNLVQGNYDERITLYLTGPRSNPMGSAPVPPPESSGPKMPKAILSAAEEMPEAPAEIAGIEGNEPEPWRPLKAADLIEIEDPIEDSADTLRPAPRKSSTPPKARTDDLEPPKPGPVSNPRNIPILEAKPGGDSEFLSVLDAEMERQLPWASSDELMTSPPPLRLDSNPGESAAAPRAPSEPPKAPAKAAPNFREALRASKVTVTSSTPPSPAASNPPLFKPPPASDTLVDFGLPAALREQLAANLEARKRGEAKRPATETSRRAADPRVARFRMTAPGVSATPDQAPGSDDGLHSAAERQTLIDMELRRASIDAQRFPARTGPGAPTGGTDTLLEIDAHELHKEVAEQRAMLRGSKEDASQTLDAQLPHTEHVPAHPLSDSKPPRRNSNAGPRMTPVIQGAAVTPPPIDAENPKSILVVERSLDEVILSYLSDDQE